VLIVFATFALSVGVGVGVVSAREASHRKAIAPEIWAIKIKKYYFYFSKFAVKAKMA
jgi:hypothetical protein